MQTLPLKEIVPMICVNNFTKSYNDVVAVCDLTFRVEAVAGYLAVNAMGLPWYAFMVMAWLSLTLIALMTLPLLGWAYNRFDVSR